VKDLGGDEHRPASYWRERAAEARASAAKLEDAQARATLDNIAQMYDSMAKLAELGKERSDS
jgi:hypothetical protein